MKIRPLHQLMSIAAASLAAVATTATAASAGTTVTPRTAQPSHPTVSVSPTSKTATKLTSAQILANTLSSSLVPLTANGTIRHAGPTTESSVANPRTAVPYSPPDPVGALGTVSVTVHPRVAPTATQFINVNVCATSCESGGARWQASHLVTDAAQVASYLVNVPVGKYQVKTTLVESNDYSATVLATASTTATATSHQTSNVSLNLDTPSASISGAVALSSTSGPLSIADLPDASSAVVVVACVSSSSSCRSDPLAAVNSSSPAPLALARFATAGTYTYALSVPAGSWTLTPLYLDLSSASSPHVLGTSRNVTVASGASTAPNLQVTLDWPSGPLNVSGAPATAYPTATECSAPRVTQSACAGYDRLYAIATSAVVVLQPGATNYALPPLDAATAAAGWESFGQIVNIAPATDLPSTGPFPLLATTYQNPSLYGHLDTSLPTGANGYVFACSDSSWLAGSCSAFNIEESVNVVNGEYELALSPGSYELFSVVQYVNDGENLYPTFVSNPVHVAVTSSSTEALTVPTSLPSSQITGDVASPSSVSTPYLLIACPGARSSAVTPLAGCPNGPTTSELAARHYRLRVSPGIWTIYVFDSWGTVQTPYLTTTVSVAGVTTTDLTVAPPTAGIEGGVTLKDLSLARYGDLPLFIACPISEKFSTTCAHQVAIMLGVWPNSPAASATAGLGVYNGVLPPGKYRGAIELLEPGTTIVSAPKTFTATAGKVTILPFTLRDAQVNLLGNIYETGSRYDNAVGYQVQACPANTVFSPTCRGGRQALFYSNQYNLSLSPGRWNVSATVIEPDNLQFSSPLTTVNVALGAKTYRDLLAPSTAANVTGTATASLLAGQGGFVRVRLCPSSAAFSATCAGGIEADNSWLIGQQAYLYTSTAAHRPVAWQSCYGVISPYQKSLPYALYAPPGSYKMATGALDQVSGVTVYSAPFQLLVS